ncbi:hypothetical protein VTP01DRAFT_9057 [Rhizomucor pusillus]|uniref:uncharacterized protein n=1 Tax=Rhizomucor pusillus TaxID=4840 RepID=UPI003742E09E
MFATKKSAPSSPILPRQPSTIYNDGAFVQGPKVHENIKTTIQNWQLRNLVACADTNTIVHPYHETLHAYNPNMGGDSIVLGSLPFAPTTIDAGHGYVAVGGQRGMALIKELEGEWQTAFQTGMGMTNSVHLSQTQGDQVRVTFCNNDHTVSVYAVPSMQKLVTLTVPAAINQAATSSDGRQMAAVGDDGKVYLYHISGSTYTKAAEFTASTEALLACAWNAAGDIVAVTSQDGFVTVWDVSDSTMPNKLAQLGSLEPRKTRNAARSIQFSKGPLDLLAYTEHVCNVNIVDVRTFETRQVIRLGPTDRDAHIAGLSFGKNGRSLFVGLETDLIEVPIDTSARRRFAAPAVPLF